MKTPILYQLSLLIMKTPSVKINPVTVLDKLQSIKSYKSPGPDGWPPIILKNCADQLCVPIAILFNKSLESGMLPST